MLLKIIVIQQSNKQYTAHWACLHTENVLCEIIIIIIII